MSNNVVVIAEDEYNELKEVFDKSKYYAHAGLDGWKKAVMKFLPSNSSLAFVNKVQTFLDSITEVE